MSKKGDSLKMFGERALEEYRRTDMSLDFAVSSVPTSCKKGCAACCKQLVAITAASEIAAIAVAYPDKLRSKRKKVNEQNELYRSLVVQVFGSENSLFLHDEEELERFTKKNEELADLWWEQQIACVFLRDDNTCGIYDARPISCRGYYVRSDPQLCFQLERTDVEVYDFHVIRFLRLRLLRLLEEEKPTMTYLPPALARVLQSI